jgi:uncharacterized membrane-anchored protein
VAANLLNKVPEVTILFWIIKMMSTTIGATGADYLNVDWHLGLTGTSAVAAITFALLGVGSADQRSALAFAGLIAVTAFARYAFGAKSAPDTVSIIACLREDNMHDTARHALGKVPAVTLTFCTAKIAATTLGETGACIALFEQRASV